MWGEYDRLALIRLPIVHMDQHGRDIGYPTIEFRLPDGSGLPHLLLAGAALSILCGRETENLDRLLETTSTTFKGKVPASTPRVPRDFIEVADSNTTHRKTLERGDCFPSSLIDLVLERLRSK